MALELGQVRDRPVRSGLKTGARITGVDLISIETCEQRLAHRTAMCWGALAYPRVHPDGLPAVDDLDGDRLGALQDCQVPRLAQALHQALQEGHRGPAHVALGGDQ